MTITALLLNELLDYYGASIEPIMGEDDLTIRIYCLNKQLPNILPIIHEILTDSIFPEDEAKIILAKWKQKQLINFKTELRFSHKWTPWLMAHGQRLEHQLMLSCDFLRLQMAELFRTV